VEFTEEMVRWAKLPPPLSDVDLAPYLHLAASFFGKTLLDQDLPERLRDIAANLLSSVKAQQRSVHDDDLLALGSEDATALLQHLGRMGRDRPTDQMKAIAGILRISRLHNELLDDTKKSLQSVTPDDITVPSILLFDMSHDENLRSVLENWKTGTTKQTTKNAVDGILKKG
jgi:hypothetical protein